MAYKLPVLPSIVDAIPSETKEPPTQPKPHPLHAQRGVSTSRILSLFCRDAYKCAADKYGTVRPAGAAGLQVLSHGPRQAGQPSQAFVLRRA